MNHSNGWKTVMVGAAVGVLLISCKGKAPTPEATSVDAPAALAPTPNAVVARLPFSSKEDQKWIKSTNLKADFHVDGPGRGWSNADGETFDVVEIACFNAQGEPEHCHLEVKQNSEGQFEPKRSIEVTKVEGSNAHKFVLKTEGPKAQTESMLCEALSEADDDDQYLTGKCKIYPVLPDYPDPEHHFCAHTEIVDGKLGFRFRFTHDECSLSTGTIHNGIGHARGR